MHYFLIPKHSQSFFTLSLTGDCGILFNIGLPALLLLMMATAESIVSKSKSIITLPNNCFVL